MIDFKFENLFGITYNSGNIKFSKTNPDILYSPVGNKVTIYDIKNGTSQTLDVESRSNIHLIDISIKELLVVIDVEGYCILINLIKKVIIGHFNFHSKATSLSISPCGCLMTVGIKNGVHVYQLPKVLTKQIEPLVLIKSYTALHTDSVKSLYWSNDSRFVLTGSEDNSIRLLNLFKIEGYSPFAFTGHKKKIIMAVFSDDNMKIYSLSADGMLFIWKYIDEKSEGFIKRNEFNNKKRNTVNLGGQNYEEGLEEEGNEGGVNGNSNGNYVNESNMVIDESEDNNDNNNNNITKDTSHLFSQDENLVNYTLFEEQISKGRYILEKKQQFILNNSKISRAEVNSKSNILLMALENGIFSIYNLSSLENIYTLQITDNKINTLSISNNGLLLAFGSKKTEQLLVWEWKSETYAFKNQGHNFDICALAVSSDSSTLISGGHDGRIKVWDTKSTACLCTFSVHSSKVTELKFPAGKINMFVSSSFDSTVRAYDLIKNINFRTMTTPEPTQLTSVAVDSNGEIVCAGSMDPYSIYVWNLKTGDIVDILSGHSGPISCLVYSSTKDLLLSGSWDKTVRSWSIYSKRGDYEVFEQNSEVLSVDLSPDNKEFSAATIKGEIYTWDYQNGVLKNILECQRDIWGGRKQDDKISSKNNPTNKHFNSISYNLSGNLLLTGGNSQYVCLYDLNFQILLKKFKLTSNRSLDGILHLLNSGKLKTSDYNLDNNEKNYDSQDSDFQRKNKGVITIEKQIKEGKGFNLPIKISKVVFSYSNRSFFVASSEGIFSFSLDALNSIESFNIPLLLDEKISPQQAVLSYLEKNYPQAITYTIALKNQELLDKFINGIDIEKTDYIAKKLPLNCVVILCEYFSKKIETDNLFNLNLIWVNSLVKMRYAELKQVKQHQKVFVNLIKTLNKYQSNLLKVMEENSYTLDYILDQ